MQDQEIVTVDGRKIQNVEINVHKVIQDNINMKVRIECFTKMARNFNTLYSRFVKSDRKKLKKEALVCSLKSLNCKAREMNTLGEEFSHFIDLQLMYLSEMDNYKQNADIFLYQLGEKTQVIESLDKKIDMMEKEVEYTNDKLTTSVNERNGLMVEIDRIKFQGDPFIPTRTVNATQEPTVCISRLEEQIEETKRRRNICNKMERKLSRIESVNTRLKSQVEQVTLENKLLKKKNLLKTTENSSIQNNLKTLYQDLCKEKNNIVNLENDLKRDENLSVVKENLKKLHDQVIHLEILFVNMSKNEKQLYSLQSKYKCLKTTNAKLTNGINSEKRDCQKWRRRCLESETREKSFKNYVGQIIKKAEFENKKKEGNVNEIKTTLLNNFEKLNKLPTQLHISEKNNQAISEKLENLQCLVSQQSDQLTEKGLLIEQLQESNRQFKNKLTMTNNILMTLRHKQGCENFSNESQHEADSLNLEDLQLYNDQDLEEEYIVKQVKIGDISNYSIDQNTFDNGSLPRDKNTLLKRELDIIKNELNRTRQELSHLKQESYQQKQQLLHKLENAALVNISMKKFINSYDSFMS